MVSEHLYLLADGPRHGDRKESDHASAQVLPFPLLAEEPQLLLLLLVQTVAVLRLQDTNLFRTVSPANGFHKWFWGKKKFVPRCRGPEAGAAAA